MGLSYWIKERHNPQLGTYYILCGQMTVKEANSRGGRSLYGSNTMHRYRDEDSYQKEIDRLIAAGKDVQR